MIRTDDSVVGVIKGIQDKGEAIGEARYRDEVAIAIDGPTVGRQIKENDVLFVDIPERHAKMVEQELRDILSPDELETFEEFLALKRKDNSFWGK